MLATSGLKGNSFLANIATFAILIAVFGVIGFGIKKICKLCPFLKKDIGLHRKNKDEYGTIYKVEEKETTTEEIKINGPNCSQEYIVPSDNIGKNAECEICNNEFTISKS